MKHYVAFHKVDEHGEYKMVGGYRHLSRFGRKRLENTIGQTVWVISGTKTSSGTIYKLCSTYTPEQVQDEGGGTFCVFGRQGKTFKPHIELNEYSWFESLLEQQGNFAFGMNIIKDEEVIKGLMQLAEQSPKLAKQQNAVHICVGRTDEIDLIDKAVKNEDSVQWLVPKDANPGDSV